MAIRIRTTEEHPHPVWEKLISEFPVAEIQGFVFTCTDTELLEATKAGDCRIPIQCIEAVEYDSTEEFIPENIFSTNEWKNKINAARFFGSSLLLLSHMPKDDVLFKLNDVVSINESITFNLVMEFKNQAEFIEWWGSIKKLGQTKPTVEAKSRQALTVFDNVIERNGFSWGGNMDGFILNNHSNAVITTIEVRQSRSFLIEEYDPARFFSGTYSKGGDFNTWLPLVYLKKAYGIPIVLLTLSTKSGNRFGYTEVSSINHKRIFYQNDTPPTANITDDFAVFQAFLIALAKRNQNPRI
jgi:hypothetical protein